jgi:cyclic nucleotide-binding protein
VKISITSPEGRNKILNLIGPGELFGEMAVLDGGPRSADVTANTNCEILAVDRRDILPFVLSQPTLGMKIIVLLCKRVRWLSDRAEQLNRRDLPGRLANTLLGLTEQEKIAYRDSLAKHGMNGEPDRQVEHDANYRRRDGEQCAVERPIATQGLDERRPQENPQKAGRESDPGREQSAQRPRHER